MSVHFCQLISFFQQFISVVMWQNRLRTKQDIKKAGPSMDQSEEFEKHISRMEENTHIVYMGVLGKKDKKYTGRYYKMLASIKHQQKLV